MMRGWRLLAGLAAVSVALYAAFSGVLYVLLPRQLALIAPDSKVGALALVTSVSFAVTAVAQPLFGAASDRTRSRWGRRLPWMVGGAVVGGAALGAMGAAGTIVALAALWVIAQFFLNAVEITSTVYLVDAYRPQRRGLVAGVLAVAAVAGGAVGTVLTGAVGVEPAIAYATLAAAVLITVGAFALVARADVPTREDPRPRFQPAAFLRGFWVSPRRHPEFAWLLAWRVCFTLAYGAVHGYLFYILTDYIGVDERSAATLVAQVTLIGGVSVVVAVLIGGWASDRLGTRTPFLIAACLVVAAGDLVPVLAPSVTGILVLAAALGIGLGLSLACGTALASEVLPDPGRHAARGLGIFNLGNNVGQAAAPLLASLVISATGGYRALFVVTAVVIIVAGLMVLGLRVTRKKHH
jgi:MFS family permease